MKINNLNIDKSSEILGLSKKAIFKDFYLVKLTQKGFMLAMQMVWLINENKREFDKK